MNSGYLGSVVIHGVLIAIGLSAASLAVPEPADEPASPGTIIDVDTGGGDGGGGGGTSGPVTTTTTHREILFTPVKALDSKQLLAQWQANQVVPTPTPVKPTVPVRPAPDRIVSTSSTQSTPPPGRTAPPVSRPDAPTGGPRTLVAPTVGIGPGVAGGPGPGATGPRGPGPTGPGSGGGGGVSSSLAASVRAEFAGIYIPLFRELGADIASEKDSGEVKLRVSPAGNVTFAGWVTRPSEALLEKIVLRSIEAMRPVSPPKGGVETLVPIRFSGSVE